MAVAIWEWGTFTEGDSGLGELMRRTSWRVLCGLMALVVWLAGGAACAVQVTLVADAHVNAARPAMNSGGISNVNVGGGYAGLFQFDLSMLPSGTTSAQISRAVLKLYVNQVNTSGVVSLAPVKAAWSELGVTYQTLPAMGSAAQAFTVSQAGGYVSVDVTAMVQGWVTAPATNFGFALTAATAAVQFDSKENDLTGHEATLEVGIVSQEPAGVAGATGPTGAVGPQGPQGIQGVAGPAGAAGAQGPAGPAGAVGAKGDSGFTYRGAYSAATSYAVSDVVVFGGASYISTVAGNVGRTPGVDGTAWGMVAVGATGATGATGAQGPAGPQGLQGAAGVAGPAGSAGAQGLPGLVYQGAYGSSTNYAAGDVVVWQGASYASLAGSNHGNTPGLSPAYWGVLTAQGPQGVTGPAGPQGVAGPAGALGPVGPPGEKGDQGAQGIAGQAGAQGLTGAQGPQGLSGPAGPQGVPGPTGVTYKGAYSSVANYAVADGVSWGGSSYVSLMANNHGNTPDQSPAQWGLFAAGGAAGAQGLTGPQGPMGPQGPQGQQGFQGAAGTPGVAGPVGPPGLNYLGAYSSVENYALADAVSFGGASYVSLAASNHGNTPGVSPDWWAVLAQQGSAGPAGAPGLPGLVYQGGYQSARTYALNDAVTYQGASYISLVGSNTGNTPSLSPAFWGVLAAQGAVGATGAPGLNGNPGVAGAVGPAGPAGPAGATGATGAVGMNFRGAWTGGTHYSVNDAVTFGGSTYLAQSSSTSIEPDTDAGVWAVLAAGLVGPAGPSGTQGAAASVQIGQVTTGAAGSAASVTNTGTATAAVLNFVIPQGAPGASGNGGGGGGAAASVSGIPYASMYHSVSYAATYYSVNNTNQSLTETPSVLTWSPAGCVASSLTVYSQQNGLINVTLRSGSSPTTMTNTTLSCQVATGQSCSAAGAVAVPAGGFVDLAITQSDSTPSPVWSALSCN